MLCGYCNREIPDGSVTCPYCGAQTGQPQQTGTQIPMAGGAQGSSVKKFFDQQSDTVNWIALALAVVGTLCVLLSKVILKMEGVSIATCGIVAGKVKPLKGYEMLFVASSETLNYGIYMIAFFVVSAVFIFLKKNNNALSLAGINAAFILFKIIQESTGKEKVSLLTITSKPNAFFWIVLICAILEVAALLLLPKLLPKKS